MRKAQLVNDKNVALKLALRELGIHGSNKREVQSSKAHPTHVEKGGTKEMRTK